MTDLDQDPLQVIETGDWVKVDADNGIVEITKRDTENADQVRSFPRKRESA